MSGRDPFPMQSDEAKRLASSVAGEGGDDWHKMGLKAGAALPSQTANIREEESQERLVTHKSSKRISTAASDVSSMYDEAEFQESHAKKPQEEDDFLDRSLEESILPRRWQRTYERTTRILGQIYSRLYGDALSPAEMLRALCLSSTLFFMIGGYWLLRSLKDPILTALCGVSVIPKAKMLSVFVVLGVVSVYNRLLDSDLERHKLFYLFGSVYFGLFASISVLLTHETIGLPNQQPSPSRILGWLTYCVIESYGSVMVSLFWSFANSNFSLESAKASYGVLVAAAQVGSILGPTVVNRYAATWGVARCFFLGSLNMLLLQGTMYIYIRFYGTKEQKRSKKQQAGVLEGIRLFAEHNYVKGIFAISCLFMVEVTIVDYTMKVLARNYFAQLHPCQPGMSCWTTEGTMGMSNDATEAFTTFMGLFGQATNTLSFFLSLFGTSAVIRFLGLRLTLLLFPSLCLAVIILVRVRPTLYVVFAAMMMLKAASYALNNPTKEMLYQPTSAAVRYKAKSWIDIFGARGSKALGSVVTNAFSDSAELLVSNGSLVGMAVASFLIWNARFMGKKFDEYMETGHIVGEGDPYDTVDGDGEGDDGSGIALVQNDGTDTSCAIYDDDETGPDEEGQQVAFNDTEDDDGEEEESIVAEDAAKIPRTTLV